MSWLKRASRKLKKRARKASRSVKKSARKASRSVKKSAKRELRRSTRPIKRAAARVAKTKVARLASRSVDPRRLAPKSVRRHLRADRYVPAAVKRTRAYKKAARLQRKAGKSTLARIARDPRLAADPATQRRLQKTAKTWGPTAMRAAATGVSFVPGYGTAAAAGLGTAAALAEGKSLSQAAKEGALAAIPGGAAAQMAAETVLRAAEGQRLDRAALGAAENVVASKAGPAGRAAFRTAVAGAQGQNIANAAKREALRAAMSYVPGGAAGNVAARALVAAARGERLDRAVRREATREAMQHVPGGAAGQAAARVVQRVARGENPIDAAREETLRAAARNLPGGEASRIAAQTAAAIVRGDKPGSALTRAAQQAANTAVRKVVSRAAEESPNMPRSLRTGAALLSRDVLSGYRAHAPGLPGHFGRASERLARAAIAKNPTLATLGSYEVARRLGISHAAAAKALRTGSALQWRPLSQRAAKMVRSRARGFVGQLARGDTAGLSPDGRTYTIETGDTGMKIAQKLVGDQNRWRELLVTNPTKRSAKYGIAVYTGQTLVLPPDWIQEVAPSAPTLTAAQILTSKATLKAWSLTDGADQAGVTDYGARPEDLSTTWGPRDRMILASFQNWRGSSADGELTQAAADALTAWAEARARGAVPAPVLPPVIPTPRQMPPEVPDFPDPPRAGPIPELPNGGRISPRLPPAVPPPVPTTPVTPGLPMPPGEARPTPTPTPKKIGAAPLAAIAVGLGTLLL